MDNIQQRVMTIASEQLDLTKEEIGEHLNSSITNDLGADSLGLVELFLAIEQEFEIDIPDEDAEKLDTVTQIIQYLKTHSNKNN